VASRRYRQEFREALNHTEHDRLQENQPLYVRATPYQKYSGS
jgi:hypothetical protein